MKTRYYLEYKTVEGQDQYQDYDRPSSGCRDEVRAKEYLKERRDHFAKNVKAPFLFRLRKEETQISYVE